MSDLISRGDAMGAVQDHFNADGFKGYDDGQQMMDRINALPSAEPQTVFIEGIGHFPKVSATSQNPTKPNKTYKDDLINRQLALAKIRIRLQDWAAYGNEEYRRGLYACEDMIISLPSAEPKTGEWIEVEVLPEVYDIEGVKTWGSKMQCDQCGFRFTAIEGHIRQYNFCPYCGSYNGGEEE